MGTATIRRRIVVYGSVQGVGFRWAAREQAERLGITGSARNRFDGAVEVEAEGSPESVARFEEWLHDGPPSASVEALEASDVRATGAAGFRIG